MAADLAAAEGVDVAALVVQVLAVGALALHRPYRDRAVAGVDVLLVVPAHVGDHREACRQRLADRLLALERAADRLGPARQPEGGVVGEVRDDAIDVAAVEGGRDRLHELGRGDVGICGCDVRHTKPPTVREPNDCRLAPRPQAQRQKPAPSADEAGPDRLIGG